MQAKQRALSKTSCNVYDMLRKYHHHHSSFWHLLYDNNQWKISNWSEIISWRIFAQSRLYAFLKKHFPEITTIACRTKIPCVCVLKICIELYLLPSSPRLLYFRCMTTLVCLDAFSHTYRNINISNHCQTWFGCEIEVIFQWRPHRSEKSQNLGHEDGSDAGNLEIWLILEFCLCTHFLHDKRKI